MKPEALLLQRLNKGPQMQSTSVIYHDTRGLKAALRRANTPRALAPTHIESPAVEYRLNTWRDLERLAVIGRGRKIKPVARHLYEGAGRYAAKLIIQDAQ